MQQEIYRFIAEHNNDSILERRSCPITGEQFPLYQGDVDLLTKISPQLGGQTFALPLPIYAPAQRSRQRLAWRNLRTLYRRTSDLSGDSCVSIYHPQSPYPIYTLDEWWSDQHDPLSYGHQIDRDRPFFEQFQDLRGQVPRAALLNGFDVNAQYANHCYYLKDCYMAFATGRCQECYYTAQNIFGCKKCVDCFDVNHSEVCYDCVNCGQCQRCFACTNCQSCESCYHCSDCQQCHHCIGCYGLINQSYHIHNQPVTKQLYQDYLATYQPNTQTRKTQKQQADKLANTCPHQATNLINTERCSGNDLRDSQGVHLSYESHNCQDIRYCSEMFDARDCFDVDVWGENASRVYNTHCTGGDIESIYCSNVIRNGHHVYYSDHCLQGAQHCFGCVGLKQHSYCILNRQYNKQERTTTVQRLIAHMQDTGERGHFFPTSMSPFPYNDTTGTDYYPIDAPRTDTPQSPSTMHACDIALGGKQARHIHRKTGTDDAQLPANEQVHDRSTGADLRTQSDDDILQTVFCGTQSKRPYRLTQAELVFYRRYQLPLPEYHPDVRFDHRLNRKRSRQLYLRSCDATQQQILSTYPAHTPFPVYNNEAYQQYVYG